MATGSRLVRPGSTRRRICPWDVYVFTNSLVLQWLVSFTLNTRLSFVFFLQGNVHLTVHICMCAASYYNVWIRLTKINICSQSSTPLRFVFFTEQCTTEYTWYTTTTYQYWFRAILGRFCKQNKIPSDICTHSPTSILIPDFCKKKILCKAASWRCWK